MSDDVIKQFVVGLGWKIDKQGQKDVTSAIDTVTKASFALAAALAAAAAAAAAAVAKIAQSFDTLYFASQRTGASVQNIKGLSYAFSQVGGSSEQALSAIESFSRAMRTNPGVGQFVKDLGVTTTVGGKARDSIDVLSDAIDAIQKKHPYYAGAQMAGLLGIDEGTFNTLSRYRKEIKTYRDEYDRYAKQIGLNNKDASESSAAFMRSLTSLGTLATVVGQRLLVALAPAFDRIVRGILSWIDAHPEAIERIFNGIAAAAEWVSKAFGFVYDKGAELFEYLSKKAEEMNADGSFLRTWEKVATVFERVVGALRSAIQWLKELDRATDMSDGLNQIKRLLGFVDSATGGVVQRGVAQAASFDRATDTGVGVPADRQRPGIFRRGLDAVKRGLGLGGGGGSGEGTQARPPEASGRYRPVYKVGEADLDQRVINTIAGEVSTKNGEGVDAVINNMMNRVGSKGWGPSGNLLEVARAKGQYAGYRAAGAAESEFVRSRIQAIASGGVPDNTNGSNAYRAAWYTGPWGQKHAADGKVIGGNRFAFERTTPNGPYAPYKTPMPGNAPPLPAPTAGGFNPSGFDVSKLPSAPALGSGTINNTAGASVKMEHNTTIKIDGAGDPVATGAAVERAQGRANDLSLRNAQTAIR